MWEEKEKSFPVERNLTLLQQHIKSSNVNVDTENILAPATLSFGQIPKFAVAGPLLANKTARILSRISRRGTDIEKMVDKFLMKNIQQKPILTAYGFFPLNKRTLFKIFAAIFTYMVILIQFKDMENTNKRLMSTKTTTMPTTIAP